MTRLFAFAVLMAIIGFSFPASSQEQPAAPIAPLAPGAVAVPEMPDAAPAASPPIKIEQAGLAETPPATLVNADAVFDPEITDVPVPQKTDADVTVMKDPYGEKYVRGTPANLSKVYWRLRVFDLDDDYAVDNYMLINECDLYQRYINDDFEWVKLRDAARGVLRKDRDTFKDTFIFVLPVKLGRYDTERGGFHLVENTNFENVRRMEITGNSLAREICGKSGEIKDYPRNLMLILKEPFSYDFSKVDEHVAQAYIIRKQKEVLDIEYDSRQSRYNRIAYVRLRVKLDEYQGNLRGQDGSTLAILGGKLMGVDLFEDPYGKMLLSMGQLEEENASAAKTGPVRLEPAGAPAAQQKPPAVPDIDLIDGARDVTPATPAQNKDARTGKAVTPTAAPDAPPPHAGEAPSLGETIEKQEPQSVKVKTEAIENTEPARGMTAPATPPATGEAVPALPLQDF